MVQSPIAWIRYNYGKSDTVVLTTRHVTVCCIHRSDFVYMVPPFLAYYGVTTQNISILQEAYTQISLYRKYLLDTNANNLWKHIQLGSYGTDNGHWSTGDVPRHP